MVYILRNFTEKGGNPFVYPDMHDYPYFTDELMEWVREHVERAHEKGATVICSTHRPVIAPSPAYQIIGKGHSFIDGDKRIRQLADMGVRLFFDGHTHIQCMKEIISEKAIRFILCRLHLLQLFLLK